MQVLNNEKSTVFVLILDKKEAKTLVDMAEAAHLANKKRVSFRTWYKKLSNELFCF